MGWLMMAKGLCSNSLCTKSVVLPDYLILTLQSINSSFNVALGTPAYAIMVKFIFQVHWPTSNDQ